jgi:hypothetical protein
MSGECNVCGSVGCVEGNHNWKVKYKYVKAGSAGPFKGSMIVKGDKPARGMEIMAPFGLAKVTSWKEV